MGDGFFGRPFFEILGKGALQVFDVFREREKRKNFFSSAAIVLLIAFTGLLFFMIFRVQNIGMNENGMNKTLIGDVFQNPSDIDDENITNAFWRYTSPEYIVVNKNGNRDILYSSTERYKTVSPFAMDIIKNMFGKVTNTRVMENIDEWKNMLSVNSVLLHFPADINPDFLVQFLEISESPVTEMINTFSDALIVTGLPGQETAVIYVKEAKNEEVVRFETSIPIETLNGKIDLLDSVSDKNYAFGYELKLDNYKGNSTLISSMLTIPLVNIETPVLLAKVPQSYSNKLMEVGQNKLSGNVMSIFGCDPRTIRSYGDKDNSRILLASNRRIVLSSDGIIEFFADGAENGIDITGGTVMSGANNLYIATSGTLQIILGMFEITGTDIENADYEIKLTKMECVNDEVRLSFDYYINGLIMEYKETPDAHAVEAVVSGGKLKSFKMELKNFVKTGETVSNRQMITAIDEYCENNKDSGNIYIYDSYLYYGYKKNNESMVTDWDVN